MHINSDSTIAYANPQLFRLFLANIAFRTSWLHDIIFRWR